MVKSIDGTTSHLVDRMENAFNAVGKIHVIGMVSGALRVGAFALKAVADAVSFMAFSIFNKFRCSDLIDGETLTKGTLTDQFKHKQIQNFTNIALGFIEIVPLLGVIESRNSTTPGARKVADEVSMKKNMAAADKLAEDFFCGSRKPVSKQQEFKQAGDL